VPATRRAELVHPQHRLDTLLQLHDALAIDRGGTAASDSFLVAVVVVLAAERQLSGAESRDLQDCSGSVAPVRHREKLTLALRSAAVDTAMRRTSPSEIPVPRARGCGRRQVHLDSGRSERRLKSARATGCGRTRAYAACQEAVSDRKADRLGGAE